MNFIGRFNVWFDQLQEPKRFLLFIGVMCFAILPLQLGIQFGNRFSTFFGLAVLLIVSSVAIVRAFGFGGRHKFVGIAMLLFTIAVAFMAAFLSGPRA